MARGRQTTEIIELSERDSEMIEDYTVELARSGDSDAARLLLKFVADNLSEGKPLPEEVSEYLAESLRSILDGKSADEALNLEKQPNHSQFDYETDQLDMVIDYWKLRESGEDAKVARHLIAESWGLPVSQVQKLVRSFKNAVKEVMDLRKRMRSIELQAAEETDLKTFLDRINTRD
jgi:hypothetical protein